uniref:NADH-ubiquinone oxidoreductase chain 5 n=1 Tax=Hystrichopsylla weida qinlingensis TaxID=2583743 RepID=A0A4P9JLE8_9NEOP|nr:NADH dehydrogenase subunit 5 [Hystrichopsylla weida qinlingensis]QCU82655.1 NADH dehydrogenase subunit 5 [Hystrichopsylla weida qinlingensis]
MGICRLSFIYLMMLSMIFMFLSLYFIYKDMIYLIEWEIISFNSSMILMTLLLDWMSLMFMSLVLFISSMVIFYSEDYMSGDMYLNRFIMLVLMFVFSMMLMIISPNLISILLGWDGLGLVSYCLVIYYQNIKSYNAGMLTVLMNRIGDVTLLLSIAWMLNYGSWNYMFYMMYMYNNFEMVMISILLMISAMTKSAQIPFSSWLPAAMAAPTPVSALVHSSTLVTAGVYLLIRFNQLILLSGMSMFLLLIASFTMFMSGLGANFEYDLKKIIALSTLSQLGLMMSSLSMGAPNLAFFHLLMHALFKALLFLCAGSIIHLYKNFQDIRIMGSMSQIIPLIGSVMGVANLALCGLPFLAGFYSKDMILESYSFMNFNIMIYILFYISTGLTICYSFRLAVMLFIDMFNFQSLNMFLEEIELKIKTCYLLMIFSIFGGSMFSWFIFLYPGVILIPLKLKLMVLFVMLMGAWIGLEIFKKKMNQHSILNNFVMEFMGMMWFMPIMSIYLINYPLMYGKLIVKLTDQGWFEYNGSQKIFSSIKFISMLNNNFQNNMFMLFMISMFFWVMILLLVYLN